MSIFGQNRYMTFIQYKIYVYIVFFTFSFGIISVFSK